MASRASRASPSRPSCACAGTTACIAGSSCAPIRRATTQGKLTGWYGATTDIHDHKLAEDALREVDQRKDEFLATLAHELRNPLAPLRNCLHILRMAEQGEAGAHRSTCNACTG